MKRARYIVGLAVLAALAAGGAELFGQRNDKPGPALSTLPVKGVVLPLPPNEFTAPSPTPQGGVVPTPPKGLALPTPPQALAPPPQALALPMPPVQTGPALVQSGLAPAQLPPAMNIIPAGFFLPPLANTAELNIAPLPAAPMAAQLLEAGLPMPSGQAGDPTLKSSSMPASPLSPQLAAPALKSSQPLPPLPPPAAQGVPLPPGAKAPLPPQPDPIVTEKPSPLGGLAQPPVTPQVNMGELQGPAASNDNPTGRQEPAVSLEWVGPPTARLNQPTSYQIIAKNLSGAPVHNVIVRYQSAQGARIVRHEPAPVNEGNVLSWNLGMMMPAQDKRIDLQIVPEAKTAISCQASVTFTGSSTLRVQVREPKLTLKAAVQPQVILGDVATVSVHVTNPGDGMAEHVKIKAQLPEGLEHTRGRTFELELGTLLPGENRTVQLVCMARAPGPQQVDCVATAEAGLSAQDVARLDVVLPRLDLMVSGPKLRYLDRHAVYVLKVTNPGSAPASNVSVAHQLPQGFKFHGASNGGRHDAPSRTVAWFVGDLTPGESREVTLETVAVNIGDHRHKTVATAARGLKTECEATTRVEGLSALLMELVDTDDPVEVGADTSYEIRVTNTGSKTETNLELVCTIPDKMEFRGAKCAADCKFRIEGKDIIFEQLPRLAPRADVIYRVVVRGTAAGDLRFRARIRADGLSEPVLREESTKVYGDDVIGKSQIPN